MEKEDAIQHKESQACKISRWQLLKTKINNLSPQDFKAQLATQPNARLIDVRTTEEFEASHLDGAIHINYLADGFWEQIEALNTEDTHFIYCRSGRRSVRVCTLMRNGGFDPKKVFNLDGGLLEWKAFF